MESNTFFKILLLSSLFIILFWILSGLFWSQNESIPIGINSEYENACLYDIGW